MNQEIISIESAEKLAKYDKVILERNNIIQFLKNEITINSKNFEKSQLLKSKEQMIVARSKVGLAQEILRMIDKDLIKK